MIQLPKEQLEECEKLHNAILNLCGNKTEIVVINALISSIINETIRLKINPNLILSGLIIGYGLADEVYSEILNEDKEIKH